MLWKTTAGGAQTGLRFVNWRHDSQSDEALNHPQGNPTVLAYQHLEEELQRVDAGSDAVLALTTA